MKDEYSFAKLVEIMGRLRSPKGCPWDKEQNHASLKKYLIEEAYEVIEAIDRNDMNHLKEELGNLLLQVVFHSQIAEEEKNFTVDDVLKSIILKLYRRHPHVFAEGKAKTPEEVSFKWEKIKRQENELSLLGRIPKELPALLYAYNLQRKAARVGFDWGKKESVVNKLKEEMKELEEAKGRKEIKEEVGDILFSLVNLARHLSVEPEEALRKTARKFCRRFGYIEEKAKEEGKNLDEMSLAEMDRLWEEAKKTGT